jgi:hypothetical protein
MRSLAPLALLAALLVAAELLLTPRTRVNGGLGYDGVQYAAMVRHFRGEPSDPVSSLAAYRVVAPLLVAWSGLDVVTGFLALSAVACVASLVLLGILLRDAGASRRLAAIGMAWWAVLPAGIRYFVYVPVLTEPLGTALLLALVLAARRHRPGAFALLLPIAVLTREPLLALAPFLLITERRRGPAAALAVTAAATIPAIAALILVRAYPPVAVSAQVSLPIAASIHALVLVLNIDGDACRYLAALPLGMGALLAAPVLARRSGATSAWPLSEWTYLAAVALVTSAVGGGDHDRYIFPLSIPLAVAFFGSRPALAFGPRTWAALTVLHVVAVRAFLPVGTDQAALAAYLPSAMDLDALARAAMVSVAAIAAAAILALRGAARRAPGVSPATSP